MSAPLWRLARELRARPLAIDPRTFAAIDSQLDAAIKSRLADGMPGGHAEPCDDDEREPYEIRDGIAIVRMRGVIGRHLSSLDMQCGGCDVDAVAEAVRLADADTNVRAIVLDIDSPGGAIPGVDECAGAVRHAAKPTVAYAADLCASAAYWIASQCDEIVVGRTSEIGSVGVYCALLDESVAYDRDGVRVELFTSGANKGAGYPGTSLTDEQRALMQSQVDELADIFKSAVISGRPGVDAAILDGRCLIGESAVAADLADETGDIDAAIGIAMYLSNPPMEQQL